MINNYVSFPQWEYKFGHLNFKELKTKKTFIIRKESQNFYNAVYKIFFDKITCYDEYDSKFKNAKNETARLLKDFLENKTSLSLGSGSAYVENVHFPNEDITLSDEAKFCEHLSTRKFESPKILLEKEYDVIFGIQLVVHLNNSELNELFNNSYNSLNYKGKFIITHTPANNLFPKNIIVVLKDIFKIIFLKERYYVLWGWRRTSAYYIRKAVKRGFILHKLKENKVNKENVLVFEKS